MRVIAGKYKSHKLIALPGKNTRPTTDRVKEAWISSITSILGDNLSGARVLDAFAGSGALGIELLSRGAETCLFCEQNKGALKILRQNLDSIGLDINQARVLNVDSLSPQLLKHIAGLTPFNLVVLDPPYNYPVGKIQGLLSTLARGGFVRNQTLVSYEHSSASEANIDNFVLCRACSPMALHLVSQKTYGTIAIDYYLCQ